MSNKLARYKDEKVLTFISEWFKDIHQNDFYELGKYKVLEDLYQSYHEFTTPMSYVEYRMDMSTFAKCLIACKILDIGGRFRYAPDYQPAPSAITRATA